MAELIIQPTILAHWHTLVNEAESACSLELGEELESYLVFLLMRFTGRPEMVVSVVAMEFLDSLHVSGRRRSDLLHEVGDKCLLFAGLFPDLAKRRRVNVNYFVDVGQSAYYLLAGLSRQQVASMYQHLSDHFVSLKDVLAAIREGTQRTRASYTPVAQELGILLQRVRH